MGKNNIKNKLAFFEVTSININGRLAKRLMAVYRTIGCQYGRCTMCGFARHADKTIINEDIRTQHQFSLAILEEQSIAHFDLLTIGNFFNDQEISPSLRKYLLRSLSKIKSLKRVLVESRRVYVTAEKLKECKDCLRNDQVLELALGYESFNSYIRNTILNKALPEKHLDDCLKMCKKTGVDFVAYILIKPHLISEIDSIMDAVATALHIFKKSKKYGVRSRVCFEPVFVAGGTPIENLWKNGEYQLIKLWTVIEVIIQVAKKLDITNSNGKIFIDLSDENLSAGRLIHNCGICDKKIRSQISKFNGHQNILNLEKLYCECKHDWQKMIIAKI